MAGAAPPAAAPAADAVKPAPPPKTVLGRQDADARSEADPPRQREPAAKEEKDMAREQSRRLAQAMEEAGRVEGRVIANGLQPAPSSPAPAPTPAAEPAAAARKPMADAAGVETRGRAAPAPALMAAPRPTGPWMDALAAGPAVQWTVNGEARAPTSSWLYALAVQTQGRWRPAPNAQPLAGEQVVSWKRGDEALGRLWLGADRVLWCDAAGRCEEAALAPDVALALGKGLAR